MAERKRQTIPSADEEVEGPNLIPFGGSDICNKCFGKLLAMATRSIPCDPASPILDTHARDT